MNNITKSKIIMKKLVSDIVNNRISKAEVVNKVSTLLDCFAPWEFEDLFITDCYFALKHINEEPISKREWLYFDYCFQNKISYKLEEKNSFIKTGILKVSKK